jgi:hypothetical protein
VNDPVGAYIAGYFDGEGSVATQRTAKRRCPGVVVVFSQRDVLALERIRDDLGMGRLCQARADGTWKLQIHRAEDVRSLVRRLYPYVRQKRAQLRIAYRLASLLAAPGRALSRFDCERRIALAEELRSLNLDGRMRPVANRHGSRMAVAGA